MIGVLLLLVHSLSGKVYFQVVDDTQKPVKAAKVTVGYEMGGLFMPTISRYQKGKTNSKGIWLYRSLFNTGIGGSLQKPGFYKTYLPHISAMTMAEGHWKSKTNPFVVMIKPQKNPVPMYGKKASVYLPAKQGEFGYDLLKGDLVTPYGQGIVSDFIFKISLDTEQRNLNLDITFSNQDDGIQAFFVKNINGAYSLFKSSYEAPETEYFPSLQEADKSWQKEQKYSQQNVNYFFRVRSKERVMYGKTDHFFRANIYGDGRANISFTYFVNPDGTPNIEFDTQQNLLKNFGRSEYSPKVP